MDGGGGGSRLVEAKFGQGEPRLVGMAATLGGGSERERWTERERGSQLAAEKEMEGKKGERKREIFLLSAGRRRPASSSDRGEIDKDSKHRTRTPLSCRVSAATAAAAADVKIDLRISSYDMQPIRLTTIAAFRAGDIDDPTYLNVICKLHDCPSQREGGVMIWSDA